MRDLHIRVEGFSDLLIADVGRPSDGAHLARIFVQTKHYDIEQDHGRELVLLVANVLRLV